jgi:hypothetical protein
MVGKKEMKKGEGEEEGLEDEKTIYEICYTDI